MPRPFVFANMDGAPLNVGDLREFLAECDQLRVPDAAEVRCVGHLQDFSLTNGPKMAKLTVERP